MPIKVVTPENLNPADFDSSGSTIDAKHRASWGETGENQSNPIGRKGAIQVSNTNSVPTHPGITALNASLRTNNYLRINAWGTTHDGTANATSWGKGTGVLWASGFGGTSNPFAANSVIVVGDGANPSNLLVQKALMVTNTSSEANAIEAKGHISTSSVSYNMYAGAFNVVSDPRFKKDKQVVKPNDAILKLDVISYVQTEPSSGKDVKKALGLNADQVWELFPESVSIQKQDVTGNKVFLSQNKIDGRTVREETYERYDKEKKEIIKKTRIVTDVKTVDYGSLVPHLILAIQNLR